MSYFDLPFSAQNLLNICHLLDTPLLFWAGSQAQAHSEAPQLTLCLQPSKKMRCFTPADIALLVATLSRQHPETSSAPQNQPIAQWHGFRSGWAGYFAYNAIHNTEAALQPLAEFYEYPLTLSLNLAADTCTLNNPRELDTATVELFIRHIKDAEKLRPAATVPTGSWVAAWQAEQYTSAFNQVKAYLQAGDCYQVNLAMPFYNSSDVTQRSPLPLLHHFNPSFGGYIKTPYCSLFSVSPERFMSIQGNNLETRPIKGTVARGKTPAEDASNRHWLANSEKNQAENLMIVDLLRNDLSLFAQPFSVKVEKLFDIETHANVHHMVSTISAQKRDDIGAAQVLVAAFPGGSITGAPKKRAMEIIDELEVGPRGAYCGSLGYFDDNGSADFNILIRTISALPNGAQCWAGGGIVMDSTCADEWQELHTKVASILDVF